MTRFSLARASVLGTFDPLALMVEFSGQYLPPAISPARYQQVPANDNLLSNVPTSIIAHELTHLTHTLGTAAGIREFLLAVDNMNAQLHLLAAASHAMAGPVLRVPILANCGVYAADERFTDNFNTWSSVHIVTQRYSGGHVHDGQAQTTALAWIANDPEPGGAVSAWESSYFNLSLFGAAQTVTTGFIHLTEGAAKIVERIQRRLHGEPGEYTPAGLVTMEWNEFREHISSPINPYYVSMLVFWEAKRRFNPAALTGAYEEYVLMLSDLAMMVDPVITPSAFSRLYKSDDDSLRERARTGYSPFSLYMRLCQAFWLVADDLPRVDPSKPLTQQVTTIQNALLVRMRTGLTMAEINSECVETVAQLAAGLGSHVWDLDNVAARNLFAESFANTLSWRADVLDGGAIVEDLLTGRDKLVEFLNFLSPSYAVGSVLSSRFEARNRTGVAVDQANLKMWRNLLDRLLLGDGPCELAEGRRERRCPLAQVSLCQHLPRRVPSTSRDAYCAREQSLGLIRALGKSELEWASPGAVAKN